MWIHLHAYLQRNTEWFCFIHTLHISMEKRFFCCYLWKYCISRTTGPNIGMFVLILMHFPCWFQIWIRNVTILKLLEKIQNCRCWLQRVKCKTEGKVWVSKKSTTAQSYVWSSGSWDNFVVFTYPKRLLLLNSVVNARNTCVIQHFSR